MKQAAPYRTFVIRCWEEQGSQPGACVYRFSLEVPATGDRFGFTHLEDLVQALQRAMAQIQTQVGTDAMPEDKPDQ